MAIGNPISLTSNVATKAINVIATASQTLFTVPGGYRLNELSVFRNGVRLVNGRDFTARDGSIVTLLSAATEGDVLEFQVFDTFRVADAITPFDSAQTIAGDLSIVGVLSATQLGSVNFNLTSGIQTFHDVRVGGALTVAGTLTYEDTTNTTNTGLSTFSGGMNISGVGATITTLNVTGVSSLSSAIVGTAVTINSTGILAAAGIVTALSFRGDGSQLSGISVDSSTLVDSGETTRVAANTSGIVVTGIATVTSDISIADKIIHTGDTNTAIRFPAADTFTVETGGSEALRVDSGQRLLVGTTSDTAPGGFNAKIQTASTSFDGSISLRRDSDNTGAQSLVFGKSRGSLNGNTIVQDDDTLGTIDFYGADGTDLNTAAAQIIGAVDGTPGSNDMPGRLVFSTTADGASSVTERLRIDSSGNVLVGKITTALTTAGSRVSSGFISLSGDSSSTNLATNSGAALSLANVDSTNNNFSNIGGYNSNGLVVSQIDFINTNHSSRTGEIGFLTHNGSAMSERLRIDSSGRIRIGSQSGTDRTSHRLQVSSDGSDSLLSLQNFSNSDGSEMDIAFYALNTNNASIKFAQIVARADETQANSSQQGSLKFSVNIGASLTDVAKFNTNGHFVPASDNTFDLGGSSERWRNIYSADLQLSNEGIGNDVDGTWGKYTIQEGENDLFLLNRRNGKKYKFMLEEV